ncbi:MAG TPA: hypothetical protein VJS65_03590 [Verrucomicrobiae bacterium]|nr:hypothetical protein [Verrucomicrobiae bacterium]
MNFESKSARSAGNRRRFLQTLGAATVASMVPFHIRASEPLSSARPVIGEGEHTYEVIHDWGQLPAGCRLGNVLTVADRGNRRLQQFDLEGRHMGFVKDELRAPCHFDERGGVMLIPDLESRVTLFDRNNRLITHLGDGGHYKGIREQAREAFKEGKFVAPHGACFDHAGNIFVVEWVEVGRITKLRRPA